jgi:hypothetical protein
MRLKRALRRAEARSSSGGTTMRQLGLGLIAAAALAAGSLAPAPARARDLCLQFAGMSCDLSGDLGFLRFMKAKLPKNTKKATALHGRACGTGVVTGTAVRNNDNTLVNVAATFVCDAVPGVIAAEIDVSDTAVGSVHTGSASYGAYALGSDCQVTIVDCAGEPGLP